jgi:endonuclease G
MKDISQLKRTKKEMMLEAADRWHEDKARLAVEDLAPESSRKAMRVVRESNFEVRRARRAIIGDAVPAGFGFSERLIGSTNDLRTIAPNSTAKKAGRPVARLHQFIEGRIPEGFGTGFLVSSRLLITNHHVFMNEDEAQGCAANFFFEADDEGRIIPGTTHLLRPERFFVSDPALDFTLVAVDPVPVSGDDRLSDIGFIRLIESPGKVKVGEPINIIQHPLGGPKQYAYTENTVSLINDEKGLIRYTTDTQGASSGSPAFNEFYEVAALHHTGIPVVVNGNIMTKTGDVWDGQDEEEVKWLANEGISISRIVSHLKDLRISDAEKARLLNELLGTTSDPLMETKPTGMIPVINTETTTMNSQNGLGQFVFNFYGNTTLNIGPSMVPTIDTAKLIPVDTVSVGLLEKKIKFDEDYDDRGSKGFNKTFLYGFKLALPTVDAARSGEMLKAGSKDRVLKYYHYSLAMNADRRMAMWTAANVNYALKTKKSRAQLGTDDWRSDPRISALTQITRKELYDEAKNVDLGHIVRRNDSAWGKTEEEAEFANSDTFHYTNCTPQHEAFNRTNPPKSEGYEGIHGVWGRLEDQIQDQLELVERKASIFAGPVLDNTKDPIENFGLGSIQYPLKFWKVICVVDKQDGPISYGFLLDQSDVVNGFGLGVERLDFNSFKKQQIKVSKITKLTGVIFDDKIYDSDVLKNNTDEGADAVLEYKSVEDIQLRPRVLDV